MRRSNARILYAALALMFVTVAIPIRLDGNWMTLAWAVEALVLVWCGLRVSLLALRWPGLLMFRIVAMRLMLVPIERGFDSDVSAERAISDFGFLRGDVRR